MSFDLTPTSLATALTGLTYMADGDSSGVVQAGGSGFGVDYTASQLWHAQLAAALGVASHTNRHVNSSMAMDVAYRWNSSGHASFWTPNAFEFVTVHIGGNDFKHWNSAAGLRGYEHNLNAIVALTRMASRAQASAGTSTGSWSNTGTSGTSGAARHTTAPGATRTLAWTGPDATLILLAYRDGSGSAFSYTVDDGPVQAGTTFAQAAQNPVITGTYGLVPVDLRGHGAGSHSVTITHTGTSGQPLVVDSLIVHATDPVDVPYLLLAPPPAVPAEALEVAFDPPRPDPEDLEVYAHRFATVQANWATDTKVSQFLPDAYNIGVWAQFDETMVIGDGYHFNLKGQTLQAEVLGDSAVRAF